jgi:preprotein translocase subunit YajC
MQVGDRVRHKSGLTGRIMSITEWVYVWLDGTRTTLPYYASSLEVIEGDRNDGEKC